MRDTVLEFDTERIIIHELLLRSSLIHTPGLLQGKMGLVIFFMHYHQFTKKIIYEEIANELIDEVIEELHKNLSPTFESGLTGIGWGIDYLLQKGFIEGNSKEICEEIDHKIMETDPRRITDYTLEIGLGGILLYVLSHCKMISEQKQAPPFDTIYLRDLYTACINARIDNVLPVRTQKLTELYISFYEKKIIPDDEIWDISTFIQGIQNFEEKNVFLYPLGITKGLAGVLLNKML